MRLCAKSLALFLATALSATNALAVSPQCKNTAQFDSALKSALGSSDYLKVCEKALTDLAAAEIKARSSQPQMKTVTTGAGQAGAVQGAADLSGAGAATQQQRKQIADQAAIDFSQVALSLRTQAKKFRDNDYARVQSSPQASQLNSLADKAINEEYAELLARANTGKGAAQQASAQFAASASQLTQVQQQNQRVAEQLNGGQKSGGVGTGTWVALGGAGLIAAGTVGGIVYFGNKGLDKMDKISEQRIDQLGDTAKDVIKDAEESAKRIIEFASASASKVLADAEKTVDRILEQAKKDGAALVDKISAEIQEQFENLSDTGIEKLRTEMSDVFAEALTKAKESGDTALESTIKKAQEKVMGKINAEVARRKSATATSSTTATNTSTDTLTDTATSTTSSTSTAVRE